MLVGIMVGSLWWDSNPQSLGFEDTEHLRNRILKKTAENPFNRTFDLHVFHHYFLVQ